MVGTTTIEGFGLVVVGVTVVVIVFGTVVVVVVGGGFHFGGTSDFVFGGDTDFTCKALTCSNVSTADKDCFSDVFVIEGEAGHAAPIVAISNIPIRDNCAAIRSFTYTSFIGRHKASSCLLCFAAPAICIQARKP